MFSRSNINRKHSNKPLERILSLWSGLFLEIVEYYRESVLRVNVSIIQSDAEQGSADLADFHIYCSDFYADSHGMVYFS